MEEQNSVDEKKGQKPPTKKTSSGKKPFAKDTGFKPNAFSELIPSSSIPVAGRENRFAQDDCIVRNFVPEVIRVAISCSHMFQSGANLPQNIGESVTRLCFMVHAKKTFYGMSDEHRTIFGSQLSGPAKCTLDIPLCIKHAFEGVGKFNFNGCDFIPANAPLICFSSYAKAIGIVGQNLNLPPNATIEDSMIVNSRFAGWKRLMHADLAARYNNWAETQSAQDVNFGGGNISMKPPHVVSGFGNLLPILGNFVVPPHISGLITACASLEQNIENDQNVDQNLTNALAGLKIAVVDWNKDQQSALFANYLQNHQSFTNNLLQHAFTIERHVNNLGDSGSAWQLMNTNDALGIGASQPFIVSEEARLFGLMLGNNLGYVNFDRSCVHSMTSVARGNMRASFLRGQSKNKDLI